MTEKEKPQRPNPAAGLPAMPDLNDQDLQAVLKALLATYQPVLEHQLHLVKNPQELQKQVQASQRNCAEEFAEAYALFEKFLTEDVAQRLLPAQARELLGPVEGWRWCFLHIRCCIVFGWLVCRWPRTFRGFSYYLYEYWKCVRQVIGNPISDPPTAEQRRDFETLVRILAEAFKPYLTDQLASVEFPSGVPDDVISGKIDCFTDDPDACVIFERLLTTEAARALLGEVAFKERSQQQFFWFCRCWCLCSLCFGCCLARARNLQQIVRCLYAYWFCLRDCFRPLTCELTAPSGCVQEQEFDSVGVFRGVQVFGTAAGATCDHYTLQWRQSGIGPWQSSGIVYPGGTVVGACGVVGGLLGYLTTYPFVTPGLVEIQLCVFSSVAGVSPCCTTIFFELQRNLVWIRGIEGLSAATPPGLFDPTAQIVDGSGVVRSFGTALRIFGSADVGGCSGQTIKRFTLSYQPGFTTTLAGAWTQFWEVDYVTSLEVDAGTNLIFEDVLTKEWFEEQWYHLVPLPLPPHFVCNVVGNYLSETYWDTQVPRGPFPVNYPDPPVVCGEAPVATWNSTPLALPNCQSGRYTLRLTVQDTGGGVTDTLRQVWFDNKNIYGKIAQIGSIPACSTIGLSAFSVGPADCSKPWPAPLLGIAYDEYIEEGNFTLPSDNFGGYSLEIEKDGGSWHSLQIPGPGSPPWGPPFVGTSRIGDPGTRCPTAVPPPGPIPPPTNGILTMLDMRRLDSVCNTNPADADLVLQRATANTPGECCGFVVHLSVWDTSICPSLSGDRHQVDIYFPFCICNDLPPVG
jgi:hypothetical protein